MRALPFLLVLALACGQQSEEEKLVKATSPVKSWAASLAYAGELWMKNRVPRSLIENSVESARKAIDKTRTQLEKSKAPEATRSEVKNALDEISDSASTLAAAVRNHDVKIAAREVARCKQVYARLDLLEEDE
jgi:hypothetical protein